MDLSTLAVLIIAVAVAVLVAVLVPAILQLKTTLASADALIKDLDGSLKPLIDEDIRPMVKSINGTMGEVEGIARAAREGVEKVDDTLDAFHEVGDAMRSVNQIINSSIKKSIIELAAYIVGLRAGVESILQVVKVRGKKEVE